MISLWTLCYLHGPLSAFVVSRSRYCKNLLIYLSFEDLPCNNLFTRLSRIGLGRSAFSSRYFFLIFRYLLDWMKVWKPWSVSRCMSLVISRYLAYTRSRRIIGEGNRGSYLVYLCQIRQDTIHHKEEYCHTKDA